MNKYFKWFLIIGCIYLGIGIVLSLWDGGINIALILLWPWAVALSVGFELSEMGILF